MSVLSCEFTVTYQDMRLEFSVTVTSVIFLENVMNFFLYTFRFLRANVIFFFFERKR